MVMYRIDGGDWVLYEEPFTVGGAGNHTVEYYAVDVAGNTGATLTTTVEGVDGGGISGLLIAALIGVAVLAAIGIVLFLLLRKKGQQQAPPPEMAPPPAQ